MRALLIVTALAITATAETISPVDSWPANNKPNTWIFDFGQQFAATTTVEFEGEPEDVVMVRQSEELMGNRLVRFNLRSGPRYTEDYDNAQSPIVIEPRSFRYVEVRGTPTKPKVTIETVGPAWPSANGTFTCGDKDVADIWNLAANAVHASAFDHFRIDEGRELAIADATYAIEAYALLTGQREVSVETLETFANREDFAETGLPFPKLLYDYFMQSGDRVNTLRLLDEAVLPLMNTWQEREDDKGFVTFPIYENEPPEYLPEFDLELAQNEPSLAANTEYLSAIEHTAKLLELLGRDNAASLERAQSLRLSIRDVFWDADFEAFRDTPSSDANSYYTNIYALSANLFPEDAEESFLDDVRTRKFDCSPYMAAKLVEGCYATGNPQLAYALLTHEAKSSWISMLRQDASNAMEAWHPRQFKKMRWSHPRSVGPLNIITKHVMGLNPLEPGWTKVRFKPNMGANMGECNLSIRIPRGRIEVVYHPSHGYRISAPPGIEFETEVPEGTPIEIFGDLDMTQRALTSDERDFLERYSWTERTEGTRAVWVSVDDQMYRIIEGDEVVWEVRCATATNGTGSQSGSMKTPLGWHSISGKLGSDAPWGQIFRARAPTSEIWTPGGDTKEDLVLTRVLLLDGEEPGKNKGGKVDSRARYIYVHGTNDEERIGQPSSHGCIRLRNDDVITAFNLIEKGAMLLITERDD